MGLAAGVRLGPYAIEAPIGFGGMGEVYRARDIRLDRVVAIKVMPASVADSTNRRQRFEREARAISALSHPHICALYDVGEQDPSTRDNDTACSGQAVPYLVMEYLEGETLAARLVRGALPMDQVLRYATEIADALDHAHRQGIVHRDLKPANVMITRSGVKLLDFGVAKLRAPDPAAGASLAMTRPSATLTEEGTIVGTPLYMAPEQLHGRDADARTDLFAFGAIVHEMATGRPVFEGQSQASIIAAILDREPAPLSTARSEAPPLLDQIITRCLAKNPDDRWQTASDLKQALTWIADRGSRIDRVAATPLERQARRRGWVAGAAIAGLAIVMVIALTIALARRVPGDVRPFRFTVAPPEGANFSQSSAFMAVSPDGHSLAFVASSRGGTNALWVRSLDSLSARQLPGTDGAAQPFWSPDSRSIAFVALGSGALKKIDVANGFIRTVVSGQASHGTWSKDGVIVFPTRQGQGGGPLYSVPATGGSPTPATSLDQARAETNHAWPEFFPDGRHFLFRVRSASPEHDGLYVGSLGSADRIPLAGADTNAVYDPKGYLLFMRVNTLLAQPFDATSYRFTGEPMTVAEQVELTAGSRRGAFSISQTGVLAYRPIAETRLTWYERSGKPLQAIGPPGRYSNPALSPDETRIAVGRLDGETGAPDIWVIDLTRDAVASRFTFDRAPEDMPLWSRDGSRIVFKSGTSLRQKVLSGTGAEDLLLRDVRPYGGPLDWSHDGGSLVYQAPSPKTGIDLWMLPLAGDRQPLAVLRTEFQEVQTHLSPDGRWMAYVSNESGTNEVYIRAFPSGEGKRQVSTHGGMEPVWRGDGRELFYLALDRNLMAVATETGSTFDAGLPTPLFDTRMSVLLNPTHTRNQYVVSADGQRFLINQPPAEAAASPIAVVVNWPAALKP